MVPVMVKEYLLYAEVHLGLMRVLLVVKVFLHEQVGHHNNLGLLKVLVLVMQFI